MDAEDAIKEAGQYYLPVIYRRVIMALHEEPQTVMQLASNIPVDRKSIAKALRSLLKVVSNRTGENYVLEIG